MSNKTAAPRRTRTDPDLRRAQILNEAIHIIGELGYNGFSIQELAKRCQLTNAGLLYYFKSKDQLLIAVLRERDERDTEAITSLPEFDHRDSDPDAISRDQLLKYLRAMVLRNITQPELVRLHTVLRAEALNKNHPAYDYFLEREKKSHKLFSRMVEPLVEHPQSVARQLFALMTGLEQQWLRSQQGFDLAEEWDRGAIKLIPERALR